jgi:hypothetical protein
MDENISLKFRNLLLWIINKCFCISEPTHFLQNISLGVIIVGHVKMKLYTPYLSAYKMTSNIIQPPLCPLTAENF